MTVYPDEAYVLMHQKYEPGPSIPVGVYSSRAKAEAQIPKGEEWWYGIETFTTDAAHVPTRPTQG